MIRPRSAPVIARDEAAVAVAAGCRPEAFAVVAGEPGPHSAVIRPWPVSRGGTAALTRG